MLIFGYLCFNYTNQFIPTAIPTLLSPFLINPWGGEGGDSSQDNDSILTYLNAGHCDRKQSLNASRFVLRRKGIGMTLSKESEKEKERRLKQQRKQQVQNGYVYQHILIQK